MMDADIDAYFEEITEHNERWKKQWPNHCSKCCGWGGTGYTEMHGFTYGAGEQMFDPCDCTIEGKCPRCGKKGLTPDEGEGPCKHCGWNYDDGLREP
jgi:hypothetical protein